MPQTYHVDCVHCKGKGKIEVAREVYINRQICLKVVEKYQDADTVAQRHAEAILGSNRLLIEQGRHIFSVDQIYSLADLFGCKASELMP